MLVSHYRASQNKYRASDDTGKGNTNKSGLDASRVDPEPTTTASSRSITDTVIDESGHQTRTNNTNIMEGQESAEYEMVDPSKMNSQASAKPLYINMAESSEYSEISPGLATETHIYTELDGNMN